MKLITRRNSIIALLCLISFTLGGFITQKAEEEKITILLVKQAQKIMGLDFTDIEADSMLTDLDGQRARPGRSQSGTKLATNPGTRAAAQGLWRDRRHPAHRGVDHQHQWTDSPGPGDRSVGHTAAQWHPTAQPPGPAQHHGAL